MDLAVKVSIVDTDGCTERTSGCDVNANSERLFTGTYNTGYKVADGFTCM